SESLHGAPFLSPAPRSPWSPFLRPTSPAMVCDSIGKPGMVGRALAGTTVSRPPPAPGSGRRQLPLGSLAGVSCGGVDGDCGAVDNFPDGVDGALAYSPPLARRIKR